MKKIIIALLFIVQYSAYAYYEIPDAIPSPNAASLGTYGIIPVSLYTGTPDISIPLYTFESRGLELPVTLRYDASGVKVNLLPSWLGHNWTLEAGGIITRTVKERCDEYLPRNSNAPNYFQSFNLLQNYYDNQNVSGIALNACYHDYDLSPDIYQFNFMGHSGYFFLDHEGKWRVQSESNLDVIFNYAQESNFIFPFINHFPNSYMMDKTIKGFIIRDDKGYEYEFGGSPSFIEYTTPFFDMAEWNAMSWYLSEVRDMYGNVLFSFEYERGKYIMQIYYNDEYTESNGGLNGNGEDYAFSSKVPTGFKYSIYFTSPIYLKKIRSGNGIVGTFQSCDNEDKDENGIEYMQTPRLYDSFSIRNGQRVTADYLYGIMETQAKTNALVNNIIFYYLSNYLHYIDPELKQYIYKPDNTLPTNLLGRTRLRKLESAVFTMDTDSVVNLRGIGYRFKYKYSGRMHLDKILVKDVPGAMTNEDDTGLIGKYSFAYDHFGEMNGDYLTLADHWGYYTGAFVDTLAAEFREPDIFYAKLGSLTEIQYPTGGTTEFEYELNDYGRYLCDDKLSMIDCASNGKGGGLRIKSITNWDSPAHTKMLGRKTYSYHYPGTVHSSGELSLMPKYVWESWSAATGQGSYQVSTIRINPIIPLSNSFGPSLGYSCVTETNLDGSYTIHQFSNISDPTLRDERYFYDYQNGLVTPYETNWSCKSFMRGKLLLSTSYKSDGSKYKSVGYTYRSPSELNDKYAILSDMNCIFTRNPGSSVDVVGFYTGGFYKAFYSRLDLIEENDTIFELNGHLATRTRYAKKDHTLQVTAPYNHDTDIRYDSSVIVTRGGQITKTDYVYPADFQSQLYRDKFCLVPESTDTYLNNVLTKSTRTIYKTEHGLLVPSKEQERVGANGPYFDCVIYKSYDNKGTLTEYEKNGVDIQLTWDSTGNRILESRAANLSNIYEYDRFAGITKMTLANGSIRNFDYDDCGRLLKEKINNQTINRYEYNFRDADTLVSEDFYQRTASSCSVSASILGHTSNQQRTFEIVGLPQEVNIMVNVSTNQNYTYACAVITGPSYSRSFNVYNKNENINETLTELLYPGVYTIRALINDSNYSSGNTTTAQISVNYDILE